MSVLTFCTECTATKPSSNNGAVLLSSAPRTDQEQLSGGKAASKDGIQVMLGLINTEPSPQTAVVSWNYGHTLAFVVFLPNFSVF